MPRLVRSALGEVIDFDLLAIKQQLAAAPAPRAVEERKLAIAEKDGVRPDVAPDVDFLALAKDAAAVNARGAGKKK